MHESLRTKGIAAIDHWLAPFIADPARPRNNWCIIELGGAMSAAAVLGDIDKLRSFTFGDCSTKINISPLTVLYTAVHHKDPKVRALVSAWYKEAWFSEGSVSMETLALLPQCEFKQKVLHAADYKAGNYEKLEHVKLADGAFTASYEASGVYPEEITMLRRTFAGAGGNVLVIVDEYEASEPVRETASFVGNNRRREMKWTLTADGGVLTREGVGVSIHALQPVTSELDYAALHDCYSITPDSMLQGREGSGYIRFCERRENFRKRQGSAGINSCGT